MKRVINDIEFVARSLGFVTSRFKNELEIRGKLYKIPTNAKYVNNIKLCDDYKSICVNSSNNKASFISFNEHNIILEPIVVRNIGRGDYYGFELDGNHRFLLGNFIVSHNSSYVYRIAMMLKLNILSVDISMYLNKKKELYSMFHN